ncbi:MAG: hypothetical protein K2X39_07995, partial [Silvanigrellaceae bacterium]|nr:hypothetical protein [Silvanigrellaceae bacterium]
MGKQSLLKSAAVWLAILALFFISFKLMYKPQGEVQKTYPQFLAYLEKPAGDKESVVSVTIRSDNIHGDEILAKLKDNTSLSVYRAADDGLRAELRSQLENKKIPINYEKADEGNVWWASLFTVWLPLIIVVGFMVLLLRNMQGASGKAMSFGKSRARLIPESSLKVTFKDVAGIEES